MKPFIAAILCTLFCLPLAAEVDGWGQDATEQRPTKQRTVCGYECKQQRRQAAIMFLMMQRGYQPAYRLPPVQVYRSAPMPQAAPQPYTIGQPPSLLPQLPATQLHTPSLPTVKPNPMPIVPTVAPPPAPARTSGYPPLPPKPLACVGAPMGNGIIALECQK